jgi:hypothetical protein
MMTGSFEYKGIRISHHAQVRALERTTIRDNATLAAEALASLNEGIDVLAEPVLRDQCYQYARKHKSCGMYAHNGVVYIFKDDTVVTLIPIAWLSNYDKRGRIISRAA